MHKNVAVSYDGNGDNSGCNTGTPKNFFRVITPTREWLKKNKGNQTFDPYLQSHDEPQNGLKDAGFRLKKYLEPPGQQNPKRQKFDPPIRSLKESNSNELPTDNTGVRIISDVSTIGFVKLGQISAFIDLDRGNQDDFLRESKIHVAPKCNLAYYFGDDDPRLGREGRYAMSGRKFVPGTSKSNLQKYETRDEAGQAGDLWPDSDEESSDSGQGHPVSSETETAESDATLSPTPSQDSALAPTPTIIQDPAAVDIQIQPNMVIPSESGRFPGESNIRTNPSAKGNTGIHSGEYVLNAEVDFPIDLGTQPFGDKKGVMGFGI